LEENTFMFGYAICGECVLCFHLHGNVVFVFFYTVKIHPLFQTTMYL
jgi:hypothetical protein